MHIGSSADPPALPPLRLPPEAAQPLARAELSRHILDDRCRTRDLLCPQEIDPKAPIRFSAFLEKVNREKPDFVLRDVGLRIHDDGAEADGGLTLAPPALGHGNIARAPDTDAPRLGDVTPASRISPEHRLTVHYRLHRPVPSGMTIDVFA